ncbi:Uncharacterised protein [Mycobacteroides abscessus subsp. abscessus]|nr:Uncharacterised protein [Mycobacteroides abscessus subsp. abscessus]
MNTWLRWLTGMMSIPSISFKMLCIFSSGMITVLAPAFWAAFTLAYTPPIGLTWPWMLISPVMATSLFTGLLYIAE